MDTPTVVQKAPELDHHRPVPVTVTFRTRYHSMVAWNAIKQILDAFEVPVQESAFLMETMTELAEAIDKSCKEESEEKMKNLIEGGTHVSGPKLQLV
jgi:hypothetical protein